MKNGVILIVLFLITGCTQAPHGKDYIYTQKDDHLSLQGKVALLRESADIHDDALLSAISLLYAQNNNWVEAKEAISKAIKLNPINSAYHLYLANYNAELAHNVEAYEEAKIAFELGTYDKKLESLLARMSLETADSVNSNEFVTSYYLSNKNEVEAQILMARLYELENKYKAANTLAHNILMVDSVNIDAIKIAYHTYTKLDSIALAIYFGEKLLKIDSTNAQYYFELAGLYLGKAELKQAALYFAKSYQYQPLISSLFLALGNYNRLLFYDSVVYYTDSAFAGVNYANKNILLMRAQALDKRYKYEESFALYNQLIKMDSTDSVVNAERALVQRKITYLWRKKREQQQLADSLAGSIPIIKF